MIIKDINRLVRTATNRNLKERALTTRELNRTGYLACNYIILSTRYPEHDTAENKSFARITDSYLVSSIAPIEGQTVRQARGTFYYENVV